MTTEIPEGLMLFAGIPTWCLSGVANVWIPLRDGGATRADIAIYDGHKLVDYFKGEGLSEDDAHEHISFNMEGGYVGPTQPIIAWDAEAYLDILAETDAETS